MTLPFNHRLSIGETIERSTAKYIIEHLGADVEKIGSLETDEMQKPLTWRCIDGIHRRLISADLNVCKHGLCYSTQVKLKNSIIHADSSTGKKCFYIAELKWGRMMYQTAEALGIKCSTLGRKMRQHGITGV